MWLIVALAAVLAPVVGFGLAASGAVTPAIAIHAALMLTAWGLIIPAGGVVARYFKVMPGQDFPRVVENLTWWRWHRGLQYTGVGVSTLALGVIVSEMGVDLDTLHGRCGLAVMILGWIQVLSALLRGSKGGPTDTRADPRDPSTWRGDHYDMTRRRRAFERWHKPAGWAATLLAGLTILLGVQLVGAPDWLLFVVACLQTGVGLALLDGVARRRWVDTYVALWGHDPRHPGNRSKADADEDASSTATDPPSSSEQLPANPTDEPDRDPLGRRARGACADTPLPLDTPGREGVGV